MTESHFGRSENPADRQLADARRDPRLAHGREAVVADWWAAMGAAERVRTLADWGIHELVDSDVREERRVDAAAAPILPIRADEQLPKRHISAQSWLAPNGTTSSSSTTP